MGVIAERSSRAPNARLVISAGIGPLALGESVAVQGACLTVTDVDPQKSFCVDCSRETLERTTLGLLEVGAPVHLERALAVGDRLGGHFVAGHVDGLSHLESSEASGEARRMRFRAPDPLARYLAEKGSVTLDGVSLTVNRIEGALFEVMLIPHTLAKTTLGALRPGDAVNLEVDLLARHVARLLEAQGSLSPLAVTGAPHDDAPLSGPAAR